MTCGTDRLRSMHPLWSPMVLQRPDGTYYVSVSLHQTMFIASRNFAP
jgi:hypothetical protein